MVKVSNNVRKKHSYSASKISAFNRVKGKLLPEHAPFGIKALIVYCLFMTVLYAIYFFAGIDFPLAVVMGKFVEGSAAFFFNLFSVMILATVVYGLVKRKMWCYWLSITWFIFNILNSLFAVFIKNNTFFQMMEHFSLLSFLTVVLINSLIIWYIMEHKPYFFDHKKKFKIKKITHKDRIVVYILVGFWALLLVTGIVMSITIYIDMTAKVDSIAKIIGMKNSEDAKVHCDTLKNTDRDVCYVVLATIKNVENNNNIAALCNTIQSSFYRYTCYRAAT